MWLEAEILPGLHADFPVQSPPKTEDHVELAKASLSPVEHYVAEQREQGKGLYAAEGYFKKTDLIEDLHDALTHLKRHDPLIANALRKAGLIEKRFFIGGVKTSYAWFLSFDKAMQSIPQETRPNFRSDQLRSYKLRSDY